MRPASQTPEAPVIVNAEQKRSLKMAEKVLLVDDEKDFLEVMAERMAARGIEVSTASSAAEAIRLAEKESFDAIIVDLMMPEMDGIEALKLLKKKKPETQVILLTGHATLEKGIEAMKLGAVDFLEKPADMNQLTKKIKKAHAHKMMVVEKQIEEKMKKIMGLKGW
jgi:DNA-binding NtrC family response regulator